MTQHSSSQTVPLIVAIDGPAGAGKSTVARALAERFGLLNLESGAMYRAFALKALHRGIATSDAVALEALAHETDVRLEPRSREADGAGAGNRVLLDGVDVTAELRTPAVTTAASEVSVHPAIRRWLVGLQQALGARGKVVMEGRDIGTAVFPHAPIKIFLDASPERRGERRYEQNRAATPTAELPATVLAEIRERDQRDRTRADSPLRPADDAVVIDSTDLTLREVIELAAGLVDRYLADQPR